MVRAVARYVLPSVAVIAFTALSYYVFRWIDPVNLVMVYVLMNVVIAVRFGQGPAVVSNLASIAAFDFYYVLPHLAFTPTDAKFFFTFFAMFVVTMLTSRLAIRSRRSAEQAVAAGMEVEKERLISSLLSSVSHDMRTPLASIAGAASALVTQEAELKPQDRRRLEGMILKESARLNAHVENLLQITRFESGNLNLERELGSLEEIVGSALERLKRTPIAQKASVSFPSDLPLIPVDALLIEQVFFNLLDNAVRYSPPESAVEVGARRQGDAVVVEIADRGPGVAPADAERVFEKFYRSGHRPSGSGLGLAIARGIVRAHGGSIGVRAREGGGSVFHFSLPLAGAEGDAP